MIQNWHARFIVWYKTDMPDLMYDTKLTCQISCMIQNWHARFNVWYKTDMPDLMYDTKLTHQI